jgi:chromate reductase
MHSVGGKGVLSRLQGVLNTFGLMLPPMTGFVYSAANQLALSAPQNAQSDDLWRLSDIEVVCHNVKEAVQGGAAWKSWPVDRAAFEQLWIEE